MARVDKPQQTSPPLGSPSGLQRDLNNDVINIDATYPNALPYPTANQDNSAQDAESETQSESAVDELEPTSKKLVEAIIPSSRVKRKHSSRAKLSSAKRRRVTK
ncbi:hypothetical protein A0H81_13214 [Grifola frondosa]|uniref:Uncharacterized protein n=1 Tax=Grifola frondosa TaxID=5627 RepID=A0A1C7LV26_GRIFR|nr:hypothetical protein A0H81_13214 [Grifola frondosa]